MADNDTLTFLLGRIATGDKKAMKAVYTQLGPDLHRFICTRMRDPQEAADVLQETMLEVWRRAGTFEGRSAARTWIFGIARNKAADRARRAVHTGAEPDEDIPDDAPTPEAALAALQEGSALRACLEKLSPPQRAVIHLAFFQDVSYRAIAEIEDCALNTVKTRIFHAKKLLMHCLSKADGR
ncbi:MAG: sigma-70 family RNA polymerase sigma factor [Pseudomonadota bacterium]